MRFALLSNVTVDLLAGMLKKEGEVYLSAGFDTWQQEMIMPGSGLYQFKPEAVVVLLHANAYMNVWDQADKGCRVIDEWCAALENFSAANPGVPVFMSSVDVSNTGCRYAAEGRLDLYFENYLVERVENLHKNGRGIYLLPVKETITNLGRSTFYSPKMWYVGSMPYSMKGLSALSTLIGRYLGITRGMRKKCLAIDLDNTIWGGVIGEDGVNGIELSDHKEGARFKDTQRLLKKMKEQGVMLAILSKNNPEDVEPVFSHPDMVLHHEDFVAEVMNWESKSVNIRMLARNLNIGLDAFVFLDDNPMEREQMKSECPEVSVVDFPKDTALLPDVVEKIYEDYFLALDVTGEDIKKTAMYRAENQRKAEMATAGSVDDFLKKLGMKLEVHRMQPEEEKRVVQLINKTNQFNVTTKRYSEEEIQGFNQDQAYDIYTTHVSDKYGDQGLISVLILKYEGTSAYIDTFLMSCRTMGRKVEDEIMAQLKGALAGKGIETIFASYIKSAKNAPVVDLFEKLGFQLVNGTDIQKDYRAEISALPDTTGVFMEVIAG